MKRYAATELIRFLKAVDRALTRKAEAIVIGGTAAVLQYGVLRRSSTTWR